jgi:transposase InsO family protein
LAAILDLYSRKIVGWAMSERIATGLVLNALAMALLHRCPPAKRLCHTPPESVDDDSAPEPGRVTAKQRIKQFLIVTADKIGDTTAGVLQTYVEKKLLGL